MKEEKILKKVDKLLKLYGVEDGEREKFLLDLKDKKYDDQEDIEEVEDGEVEEEIGEPLETEESTEEVVEEQPSEEVGEEPGEEEVSEDAEEPLPEEQPAEPVEEPIPEEPAEQPIEEPVEQPAEQPVPEQPLQDDDTAKTIEGLQARIAALEDLVSKLGTPVEDAVGVEPRNPSGEDLPESEFDRLNRMRMGR